MMPVIETERAMANTATLSVLPLLLRAALHGVCRFAVNWRLASVH